jgi:hypothetical protein
MSFKVEIMVIAMGRMECVCECISFGSHKTFIKNIHGIIGLYTACAGLDWPFHQTIHESSHTENFYKKHAQKKHFIWVLVPNYTFGLNQSGTNTPED